MSATVLSSLADALTSAAAGNSHAAAPAAAVLWTDKERQWSGAIGRLLAELPQLVVLGDYRPDLRTGPAIWLKCAIARTVDGIPPGAVPVVYLPGVSRSDLRAIETCPRDLQPLAELQYRGAFWCQSNGKDWTVNAFLSAKASGIAADVAQDRATQDALLQALEAGVLLERSAKDLEARQVNAEWLRSLLAPNPTRDLLQWMNDAAAAEQQWGAARWNIFLTRCRADFGFDPVADGVLTAAERLASGQGKWAAVAELYRDSYPSFPNVFKLLAKVQPPQQDLFGDPNTMAGYPQVNESQEATLRYRLSTIGAMPPEKARAAILEAEQEHGSRRGWLWAFMGAAPLAQALGYLAEVATASAQVPTGATPDLLAQSYKAAGWKVDAAALQALGAVQLKADIDVVGLALRAVYLPWAEEAAQRLQDAVKAAGGLGLRPAAAPVLAPGTCTVFVDGLRYDTAVRLSERLASLGQVRVDTGWTSMPSVTASGKAWCSPVAHLVAGDSADVDFEPRNAADGKALNLSKLLVSIGVQALDRHELGDALGTAWTEAGNLDHYGHAHGIRLARDMETQLGQVVERVSELRQAGWKHFRIVTDHGWLLMPGYLPKAELQKHQTATRWGRCAVLKDSAHGTSLTFGWDWCKDVQVAYAPGVSSFVAGHEYAHGGLSLQECLVPTLTLAASAGEADGTDVTIQSVTWKRSRCVVLVEPHLPGVRVDIRTKASLASSSLVDSIKLLEAGKASLALADDDHAGTAAIVVLLNEADEVILKKSTTVGE